MDKSWNGCNPNFPNLFIVPPFLLKSSCSSFISISQKMRSLCSSDLTSLAYPYRFISYVKSLLHSLPFKYLLESPYGDIGNGGKSFLHQLSTYYPNIPKNFESLLSSELDAGLSGDRPSTCFNNFIHLYAQHPIPYDYFFLNNKFGGVNNTQNNTKSVTFYGLNKIFCGVVS